MIENKRMLRRATFPDYSIHSENKKIMCKPKRLMDRIWWDLPKFFCLFALFLFFFSRLFIDSNVSHMLSIIFIVTLMLMPVSHMQKVRMLKSNKCKIEILG